MNHPEHGASSATEATSPGAGVRVALVNMPFAAADRPSIQCGLLKAALTRAGHQVDVFYFNLRAAAALGAAEYKILSHVRTDLFLGDWLFAAAAFGPRDDDAYRDACPAIDGACEQLGWSFDELCEIRNDEIPELVQSWVDEIDWSEYTAIGFSCTFEQNTAAFALAQAIKREHPGVITIFGGANFDGDMGAEYTRALPWIDYAVIGEGDHTLPALIDRLAAGQSGAGLPGVVARVDGALVHGGPAPMVRDLDALPLPDYDEYFDTLFALGREQVLGDAPPLLLFESARGCWWGQKHHCTFCGLNANGMAFRSKSPARVHLELDRLSSRYKILSFEAVDNIMDPEYLVSLCQPLTEERYDYQLFYEVKSNLTRAQLGVMARAGITTIQPGIESLSSHILALMRKGVKMLRNVRTLKWARYHGIRVGWNILTGFPGETENDYHEQLSLVPLLHHLPPPSGCGPIWLERFSPYFTDRSFPVRHVRPRRTYSFIYPDGVIDLEKIAYFFDYQMGDTAPAELHQALQDAVEQWKERWQAGAPPLLVYQRAPDWIQIIDRRGPAPRAHALQRMEALIYEYCSDTDRPAEAIAAHLRNEHGLAPGDAAVDAALARLCDDGLSLREGERYLSLALPINLNW